MSRKIALLIAPGFEEGEATVIADVLRRAGFLCQLVSTAGEVVTGAHQMKLSADLQLAPSLAECLEQFADYDMLLLPGGWTGVENLEADQRVLELVRAFAADPQKYLGAICAAPGVLARAGVVKGRTLTSYPSEKLYPLFEEANYTEDTVALDGHLITSRGPASALPFAFAIVDLLGGESAPIKERFLYQILKEYPDA